MSSWAENFTTAATWQLKHQIAYWKSKAVALEYENRILHDIIKKNYMKTCPDTDYEQTVEPDVDIKSDSEKSDNEDENDDLEVSEEFIQFLKANAKYKEDAKQERERLKAKMTEENPMDLEETQETESHSVETLKELYGKDWQKISALEMSMKCDFINECDKERPMYWPNIPFNFNFG